MNLTDSQVRLIFSIMQDLTGEFSHTEIRQRVGGKLLELLKADYFASYVWDEKKQAFVSGVQLNMSCDNLKQYNEYYQFSDPITLTLKNRRKATPVSEVMEHKRLVRTEFFNDFLKRDGLCYGINYFAYDKGQNIGDLRIWRGDKREDFNEHEALIIDAIGPCFVNALVRAKNREEGGEKRRFSQLRDDLGFTRREAEVADLLVTGLTDEQICSRLLFSKPTLRSHITAIFRKSGLSRRTQLAGFLSTHP